ncbi:hypothetical protein [Paenibacillus sp. QZ-Y1]|uniref:hypothetical protein n=1 Tax=Paenibacillus sp. QZ-Y1 TaxID=3414511 RepID=UPI003F78F492
MASVEYLDQEGLQLKIENKDGFEFQLFWNHDSPEKSFEYGEDDEFYIIVKSRVGRAGVDFSLDDAIVLRDTLDHMIKRLSK